MSTRTENPICIADNRVYEAALDTCFHTFKAWTANEKEQPALYEAQQRAWVAACEALDMVVDAHCARRVAQALSERLTP